MRIITRMSRTARASVGGVCYHVLNAGNNRSEVFHTHDDFANFVTLITDACGRMPMRVLGYCLLPDHFHLVIWPKLDGDLSRWMQWLLTAHVRRYHRTYEGSGHIWQGRFKAFPVQRDEHLVGLIRYIEQNPVRLGVVERAEDWPWSSLSAANDPDAPEWLDDDVVTRNKAWIRRVNSRIPDKELARIRVSVARGTPYGSDEWTATTVRRMGLESTVRPRGRPRKHPLP
jgi:putative transposase